jgi:hypothetical protein
MKGRHLAIGLIGALVVAVTLVFWLGATGGGRGAEDGRELSASSAQARQSPPVPSGASSPEYDGGAIARTIADRRVRDELRRRILAGWAEGEGETAAAARAGRIPPMPASPDGRIDHDYIRSVIREDMMPMAAKCYEELTARRPDAGGRIELAFKIVGDDKLGGIVDTAEVDGGIAGALGDAKLETCLRESLLSLAFRPPPNDGWVTVVYPMEFSPNDRDD